MDILVIYGITTKTHSNHDIRMLGFDEGNLGRGEVFHIPIYMEVSIGGRSWEGCVTIVSGKG